MVGVHDWSHVPAGLFHDFHQRWAARISDRLNTGLLPDDYFSLVEQRTPSREMGILTLHQSGDTPSNGGLAGDDISSTNGSSSNGSSFDSTTSGWNGSGGGVAMLAPPEAVASVQTVQAVETSEAEEYAAKADRITVRHVSGHQPVATIELISPGNKDRGAAVEDFCQKSFDLWDAGRHLLIVDILPPNPHAPDGLHAALWSRRYASDPARVDVSKPFCLVSYRMIDKRSHFVPEAYFTAAPGGSPLPDMPLFLTEREAVKVPLSAGYDEAWRTTPRQVRQIVEADAS